MFCCLNLGETSKIYNQNKLSITLFFIQNIRNFFDFQTTEWTSLPEQKVSIYPRPRFWAEKIPFWE